MAELPSQRILERLAAEDGSARKELAVGLVKHVLAQRLGAVVAPAELYAIVMAGLTRENIAREVARHVLPGVRRYSAQIADASERVGDLVPPEALAALRK